MLTKSKIKQIRIAIESALNDVGQKFNIEINTGNCTYSDNIASMKLEISTIAEDGTVNTKEAEDFKHCCYRWHLEPTDLGKTITLNKVNYTIIGCRKRCAKPILCRRADGQVFRFPPTTVLMLVEKADREAEEAAKTNNNTDNGVIDGEFTTIADRKLITG